MGERVFDSDMHVIYLFGAGASMGNVDDLPNSKAEKISFSDQNRKMPLVPEISNWFESAWDEILASLDNAKIIRNEFKHIFTDMSNQKSIDTLAKFYYLTSPLGKKEPKYIRLKFLIFVIFHYLHVKKGFDLRYSFLWAAIIGKDEMGNQSLPKNCTFLTWNYDYHLELSLAHFLLANQLSDLNKFGVDVYNELSDKDDFDFIGRTAIIKLNGSSNRIYSKSFKRNLYIEPDSRNVRRIDASGSTGNKRMLLRPCLDTIKLLINKFLSGQAIEPGIRFSWESDSLMAERIGAIGNLQKYKKLVCIGYSFPTFNRIIDSQLVNMFGIKEIVIQAKSQHLGDIEKNIKALFDSEKKLNEIKITHITGTTEFHVPNNIY